MGAQHPGHFLHRLQTAAHRSAAPGLKKSLGPEDGSVAPEMSEGFFQLPRPGRRQLAGQQSVQLLPGAPANPAAPAQQGPAHMLELLGGRLEGALTHRF